jgi:tetratricopeptide (TPR) repeat protein
VVFDNADQSAALERYLPRYGVGHVLITSPNPVWPAQVRTLGVPTLPEADAIAFLLGRTGQSDEATAAVIAEELGWLPLALEQAATYIAARGLSLTGYLERFRSEHRAALERGEPHDYSATIATTWKLAFRGATQQAPGAGDLLNLIAFFAPDMIPLEILTAHTEALPQRFRATIGELIPLDDAVTALHRYSLVEVIDDRTVSVHRLVQLVVRSQGTTEDQEAWALAAIDLVTAAFPSDPEDVSTWPECERLVTHARTALRHLESLGTIYYDGSGLRNRIGLYLFHRGQLDEARVVLERGLAIAELALDPDSPEIATRLANLAAVLLAQTRLDAARELLERAVAIEEKVLDPSHPQLAIDLSNLGVVLMQQGDLNSARQRLERALSIHEDALGTDHPSVAKDLNNLADVLRQLGDLDGAVELLERSSALGEAKFGTNHATVGWRLIRLAGLQRNRGDNSAAGRLLARAQSVDEQVLGFAYPHVTEYLDAIAAEYRRIGESAAAQPLLERALAIKEEFLGPLHREVAIALNNLGTLLFELGEPAKSQELLKRALAIREQVLDPTDPELANLFHNLALVTQDLGDIVSARALMERALELWKRPGNQEQMITSIMSLAMMEAADGATDSAVRRLRLLLPDLWNSGPSYNEGLAFTLLARLAEPNREVRLRLLAVSLAVFEQIGRPEVDECVRQLNELAETLGYNHHQVAGLMFEVRQEYARDRGQALIAGAFGPEPR